MSETLQVEFDTSAPDGMRNKSVATALDMYLKARRVRSEEEAEWEDIAEQYQNSFSVGNSGAIQSYSKLMYQAHNSVVKRMKRPDRRFLSDMVDELALEVVRDGVNSVQDWGGFLDALITDWGAYHRFCLFGNAFVMMGAGDEETPVTYQNLNLMNVYVDPYATTMRNPAGDSDVSDILIIFEYSYDEAKRLYPNMKFLPGRLPIAQKQNNTETYYTNDQETEIESRIVEVGHYYNISDRKNPIYTVFAGGSATVLEEFKGKKYQFWHRKKPFVPVLHFKCFPQPSGFYAKGIGHLIYDLAVVEQKLDNMAYAHVEENVYPVTVLNSTNGRQFLSDVMAARELKAMGERAYVINQQSQTGGSAQLQSLQSDPLTQEYERIKQDIMSKIKRSGFPLDELDIPASQTATASTIEATSITSFVQQIQEVNTETYKDADLFTIDILRDTVSTKNKTNIMTKAELPGGKELSKELGGIAIGEVVDILENQEVTVDVISKTGAYKDPIAEKMELNEILALVQGTPMATKFLAKRIRMNGFKVNEKDLIQQNDGLGQIPQSATPAQGGANALGEAGGVAGAVMG